MKFYVAGLLVLIILLGGRITDWLCGRMYRGWGIITG